MEMIYSGNTLIINVEDVINFTLIKRLRSKLYRIIDTYHISNIELNILYSGFYDTTLISDLLNDYKSKYSGHFIIN